MNRTLLLLTAFMLITLYVSGQNLVTPNRPVQNFNSEPGYITINEFSGGPGLGIVDGPFAQYFVGFTTIHGYQINKNFVTAAGAGFSVYNGGNLIPIFIDLRYRFFNSTFTPYIVGDGGVLLNPSGGTKLFVNPVAGIMYTLSKKVGINFGAGLFVQKGDGMRDSYINFKLGVTFMPLKQSARNKSTSTATRKTTSPSSPSTGKTPVTQPVPAVKKTITDSTSVVKIPEKAGLNPNPVKSETETKKPDTLNVKVSLPEIKKNEPAKVNVVETKEIKDTIVFRIQFQSSSTPKGSFILTVAGKPYNTFEYLYAGSYRSTVGIFRTLAAAQDFQKAVRSSGYPQAFVVVFKNNVRSTDPALLK
jgi:hypothetical protein